MAMPKGPRGQDIIAAIKQAGVRHVCALPDITTSAAGQGMIKRPV